MAPAGCNPWRTEFVDELYVGGVENYTLSIKHYGRAPFFFFGTVSARADGERPTTCADLKGT